MLRCCTTPALRPPRARLCRLLEPERRDALRRQAGAVAAAAGAGDLRRSAARRSSKCCARTSSGRAGRARRWASTSRCSRRSAPPRALGRPRLSACAEGRGDPARRAHRRGGRRDRVADRRRDEPADGAAQPRRCARGAQPARAIDPDAGARCARELVAQRRVLAGPARRRLSPRELAGAVAPPTERPQAATS